MFSPLVGCRELIRISNELISSQAFLASFHKKNQHNNFCGGLNRIQHFIAFLFYSQKIIKLLLFTIPRVYIHTTKIEKNFFKIFPLF